LPGTVTRHANFYKPTFKVALDHHFSDDIMGYVSFSRGFKAGTFNTLQLSANVILPEVLDAYEIGVKSTFLDKRLQLNGSFFYYNITNPQVSEIIDGVVSVANAGSAEVKGVDLESQYLVSEGLLLRVGGEFLDAHYTSFNGAPFISPNPNPPYGALPAVPGNAAGNQLVRAPRFSLTVGLNYNLATEIGSFTFDTSYAWKSGFKFDPDGFTAQRSFGLLDASLTYELPDNDQWQFRVWGKNLTQEKYFLDVEEFSGPPGYPYTPGAPATFGITVDFKFSARNSAPETTYTPPSPQSAIAAPISVPRSYLVFFDFNKSDLTPQSAQIVDQAAKNATSSKVTRLEVTGHTDTVGSDAYNMRLSRRRAEAVANELEAQGVSASEIEIIAKGKRDLLVPTADGVREPQNRRVQIVYADGAAS
jgi:outer membrane protein OmpA-like peptidoglycan-associated protein